jgi:hypothetical protein
MTPAQRAALQWAIDQARLKETTARRGAMKSATAFGAQFSRGQQDKFTAIADALESLLTGETNA